LAEVQYFTEYPPLWQEAGDTNPAAVLSWRVTCMADSAGGSRRVLDRMCSEIRGWGCWSVRETRDDAELPAPPVQIARGEPGLAEVQ